MLTMLGGPRRFCDGLTRRETLKAGALSLLPGFTLPGLLQAEERRPAGLNSGKARSVVLLYLHGGAPTQDIFDMKPRAPREVRGEFKPVSTSAPGIEICEHLPNSTRWMHRSAIVRSVTNKSNCHNTLPSFTGYEESLPDLTILKETYPPSMGSVCEYLKDPGNDLPAYVHLPAPLSWGSATPKAGPYAGFLGKRYDPLETICDPYVEKGVPTDRRENPALIRGMPRLPDHALAAGVTLDRLNNRKSLLDQLDQQLRQPRVQSALGTFDRYQQRAFDVLTSQKLKAAFDPDRVDASVRARYGDTLFGTSAFFGLNLVEAGVRFVTVLWDWYNARIPNLQDFGWDTHMYNFPILRKYLPQVDLAFSSLMEDLESREILDETLIVIMSDFGRTPRVNNDAGRDHWIHCYSVLFAGAGIRGGTVYGASDDQAAWVKDRPVATADICATIYACLGIDPHQLIHDRLGRPVAIAQGGEPIHDILAWTHGEHASRSGRIRRTGVFLSRFPRTAR